MIYIFISSENLLYNNPDAYILEQKDQRIPWGATLKVYPVYQRGDPTLKYYHKIYAMFSHEGSYGGAGDTQWIESKDHTTSWYDGIDNIDIINSGKVVYFDLGSDYPKYFKTKEDLSWYITNIYDLEQRLVNDEYPSEE